MKFTMKFFVTFVILAFAGFTAACSGDDDKGDEYDTYQATFGTTAITIEDRTGQADEKAQSIIAKLDEIALSDVNAIYILTELQSRNIAVKIINYRRCPGLRKWQELSCRWRKRNRVSVCIFRECWP